MINQIDVLAEPIERFSGQTGAAGHSVSAFSRTVKRIFDIVLACFSLLFFSPLCLAIYLAIRMEDGEPAIFCQERVGYRGKTFSLYKFRSMRTDAESEGTPQLCRERDDRLTRVGRFIRAHHLDEFPQLWNVLKGDMSLVGPRPERRYFIDKIMEHDASYPLVFEMRPGLTSEATLYNGYTDTMEKMLTRLHMDIAYLKKRTLWTDVTIIFKTFASIVSGRKF